MFSDVVELLSGGGVDRFGDPVPPISRGVFPAEVQPLSSEDLQVYKVDATVTRLKVFMAPTTLAITTKWQLKYEGVTYNLYGEPSRHKARGRLHHLELIVTRTAT